MGLCWPAITRPSCWRAWRDELIGGVEERCRALCFLVGYLPVEIVFLAHVALSCDLGRILLDAKTFWRDEALHRSSESSSSREKAVT